MDNILLAILYCILVISRSLINYYILLIMKLTTQHKMLVVGGFTIEDVPNFHALMYSFNSVFTISSSYKWRIIGSCI